MSCRSVGVAMALLLPVSTATIDAAESFDRAARIEEVRAVEIAFAASVTGDRPELFAAWIDDAAVFVSGTEVTRGREAIVEAWKGFFGPGRPSMVWAPAIVELSADGELGF